MQELVGRPGPLRHAPPDRHRAAVPSARHARRHAARAAVPSCSLMAAAMQMLQSPAATPLVDRKEMVRDELMAVLPHLRRLPERVDRILAADRPRRAADADRRSTRTAGASCARSSTAPCSAGSAPRCSPSPRVLLVAGDPGPLVAERHRPVRDLRLRRAARRRRARAARRRRSRPGRHDMTTLTPTTVLEPQLGDAVRTRRPPAGRALLPPPRRRRPARRVGRRRRSPWCCSSTSPRRRARGPDRPRPGGDRTFRTPLAQLLLGVVQLGRVAAPAVRARLLAVAGAAGDVPQPSSERPSPAPAMFAAVDLLLDPRAGDPGSASTATPGWIATTFPSSALHRSGVRRRDGRPSRGCRATWRHAADRIDRRARRRSWPSPAPPECPSSRSRSRSAALAGVGVLRRVRRPESAAEPGRDRRGPGRRRYRRHPAGPASGPSAAAPSSTGRPPPDGGLFLKVYGRRQPRRRPAVPLLPHARAPRLRRRLAAAGARPRRRARGVAADVGSASTASPAPRCGPSSPLPDGSMVLAMQDLGGRRLDELAADDLGGDAARRPVAPGCTRCTGPAWPTGRCGRPTCS